MNIHLLGYGALTGALGGLCVFTFGIGIGPVQIAGVTDRLRACEAKLIKAGEEGKKATSNSSIISKVENEDHAANSAITAGAAERYIAAHRVQKPDHRPRGQAAVSGGDGPAPTVPDVGTGGDPAPLLPADEPGDHSAGVWVAVREEDILACTADFEAAWTGYSYFRRQREAGLMEPEPVAPPLPSPTFAPEPR